MVSYIESLLSFQKLFFFLTLHLLLQLIVYIEDIIVAYPKGNVLFFLTYSRSILVLKFGCWVAWMSLPL